MKKYSTLSLLVMWVAMLTCAATPAQAGEAVTLPEEEIELQVYPCSDLSFMVDLSDTIRNHIQPDAWGEKTGASIEERSGRLVVIQTPRVHDLIREYLEQMREKIRSLVKVQLQICVGEGIPEKLKSLGKGFGDALNADEMAEVLKAGKVEKRREATFYNGQSETLSIGDVRGFVGGYDEDTHESEVANLQTGFAYFIRAGYSSGQENIALDFQPAYTELVRIDERANAYGKFQRPVVIEHRVGAATAKVPVNASVLFEIPKIQTATETVGPFYVLLTPHLINRVKAEDAK